MNTQWENTQAALTCLKHRIKCTICGELPKDPHLLWCKHSFCKDCILQKSHCPMCQYPIEVSDVVRNIMLGQLLNTIMVSAEICASTSKSCNKVIDEQLYPLPNTQIDSTNETNIIDEPNSLINNVMCKTNNPKVNGDKLEKNKLDVCKPTNQAIFENQDDSPTTEKKSSTNHSVLIKTVNKKKSPDATPRVITRRKSNSYTKNSLRNGNFCKNTSDVNLESSIKCIKEGFKTPKSRLKTSPASSSPALLFSAKKIQSGNKVNVKGETKLQIACRQGKLELIKKLLDEGADPNVKDYASWTPLCDAVGSGNLEVVQTLLQAGAWVNTPSHLNTTALVEAVVRKDAAMVRLLLSYGADMHQRTALNNTALCVADDKMRRVLLSSDVGTPLVPVPIARPSARTVLAVELSPQHTDQLMMLCRRFNLSLSTTFIEEVTHVVVETSGDNVCSGSVAVMLGLLSGCCVVSADWVSACLSQGQLLPASDFEPNGTDDYPHSKVFCKARQNKELLLPKLFDGCHISLQHDQPWDKAHKQDVVALIQASGAVYQPRQCDADRVLPSEQTVMFHAIPDSPLGLVSHIVLYQQGPVEPLLKYNMAHVKSLPLSWFLERIKTFTMSL